MRDELILKSVDVFKTYIIINNENSYGLDKFLVVNVFHFSNFLVGMPLPFGKKIVITPMTVSCFQVTLLLSLFPDFKVSFKKNMSSS